MSNSRISINFERPDFADKRIQGNRGPFAPIIMALQTLIAINKWQFRQKDYPLLYKSGIFYYTSSNTDWPDLQTFLNESNSEWHDVPTLLQKGKGDCKDLVCYRVAELSHYYNVEAKPLIKWRWVAKDINDNFHEWDDRFLEYPSYFKKVLLVHVLLQWPDGHIECPSKILGMGGEYA